MTEQTEKSLTEQIMDGLRRTKNKEGGDKPIWVNLTEQEFQAVVVGLAYYAKAALTQPQRVDDMMRAACAGLNITPLPLLDVDGIAALVDALAVWHNRSEKGQFFFQDISDRAGSA